MVAAGREKVVPPPNATIVSVQRDLHAFLEETIYASIRRYVLDKARSFALASNLPDKFADGMEFIRTGPYEYRLVNKWRGKWGEPLAQWFEEGTKNNYIIEPKIMHRDLDQYMGRDRARIAHGDGTQTHHPRFLAWFREGMWHFRRRVIHPGRIATNIMQKALDEGSDEAARHIRRLVPDIEGFVASVRIERLGGTGPRASEVTRQSGGGTRVGGFKAPTEPDR